jgi:hypothetical protein
LLLTAKSQQNYTVMEKEMLSIVATSEEFWDMLLGVDLHVFTNHENLTFDTLKMQRVLHWCNKVEEFSRALYEAPHNILVDNLSQLHCIVTPLRSQRGRVS